MSDGPRLPETHAIAATDGYVLQAMRYPAQGVIAGRLIVAGATGVPSASTAGLHSLLRTRALRSGRLITGASACLALSVYRTCA